MNGEEAAQATRKILQARRVYGDPIERDGITVIPAVRIRGRAGGRNGRNARNGRNDKGARRGGPMGGFRVSARPAGVYVVRDGKVRWMPAVDVNRVVVGAQVVGMVLGAFAMAVWGPRRWYARDARRR